MTAFSRERQQPRRADLAELAELDAALAAMESGSEGDLEDDFLLTATQVRADGRNSLRLVQLARATRFYSQYRGICGSCCCLFSTPMSDDQRDTAPA